MKDYSEQHKKAWEYDAYAFWVRHEGTPEERAKEDTADPRKMLRKYADYFDRFDGVKIANICGSCGKKAIPLALLGADVTVFDISEANKRYAMETAQAAKVILHYEVCDVLEIDLSKYTQAFDVVFMEGGILHDYLATLPLKQSAISQIRRCISRFFYRTQERGIQCPSEISFVHLETYYQDEAHTTHNETARYTYNVSDILLYMVEKGMCQHGLAWYLFFRMQGRILHLNSAESAGVH